MELFQKPFCSTIEGVLQHLNQDYPQLVLGLDDSARAVLISQVMQQTPRPMIVVEPSPTKLSQLAEDLSYLIPQYPILQFPSEEAIAIEYAFASKDDMMSRIQVLRTLLSQEPCVILTDTAGLRKELNIPTYWQATHLSLALGSEISRGDLTHRLSGMGYTYVSQVEKPGEFSVRGSIIDVYALDQVHPWRLDFFDNELDSIRIFDEVTQQSIENIEAVTILPAQDIIFPIEAQQELVPLLESELAKYLKKMKDQVLQEQVQMGMKAQLSELVEGQPLVHWQAYLKLWQKESYTLLDYISPKACIWIFDKEKLDQQVHHMIEEEQFWLRQEMEKGQLLPGLDPRATIRESLKRYQAQVIYLSMMQKGYGHMRFSAVYPLHYRNLTPFFNQMPLVKTETDHWVKQGFVIQVLVESHSQAIKTQALFEENQIGPCLIQTQDAPFPAKINIQVGHLSKGFEMPLDKWVILTSYELFNRIQKREPKTRQQLSNAERIKSYSELSVGDYVVHVHHGIGKYMGMDTIEMNGIHRDLLSVVYQDNSRILIPIDQINLLQKYVASEAKTPKLHKLGGTEWAKTKYRVAERIEDIADELIELYAKREKEVGYAFSPDTVEQSEFENAFAYVETEDQLRSSYEIKQDMEKPKPMDRLLVGDVGYGKTEVAMRAIFKAVMDGKQVAFLVPTTILAQQHYNTLVQRFNEYPFTIGLMSRFVNKTRQTEVVKGLKTGAVNIVVGTHRLLSKDVVFEDLGLLIVDEEQRFGVKHKERLKQLKSQVDVLTLTATPIPRTLHMSMIGVRDLSLIETPPQNRYPVQTYVMEKNEAAIKTAIERELDRGGQVFYLYNRVATIDHRAMEIQALVPEARVAVAHGQMTEIELETILVDFIQGQYDILVTTTIIETGVDIPNANTLFVEDADQMGLSTLYQLRGRVGRTNRVAYAYLMYAPFKQLSEVSEKRLQAIREFTELGSGFKIAMRDLSIRGAGNLLGKQQSGFIDSVGFDLYSQMLKEAVDVRRGIKTTTLSSQDVIEWDIQLDAYIPSSYISDESQKIEIYKAIQKIDSQETYRAIQDDLLDRYGEFPDEVADLLEIAFIRYLGTEVGLVSVKQMGRKVGILFQTETSQWLKGPVLMEALQVIPNPVQVQTQQTQLLIQIDINRLASYQWLAQLRQLLMAINELKIQPQ